MLCDGYCSVSILRLLDGLLGMVVHVKLFNRSMIIILNVE